jgi:hypothetical protein
MKLRDGESARLTPVVDFERGGSCTTYLEKLPEVRRLFV